MNALAIFFSVLITLFAVVVAVVALLAQQWLFVAFALLVAMFSPRIAGVRG